MQSTVEHITVSWFDDNHTILLFDVKPSFTSHDYIEAVKQSRKLIDLAKPTHFHIIADISEIQLVPPYLITIMRREYRMPEKGFSNITVFVGASIIIRHLVNIFSSAFAPHKFLFADTFDEAVKLLQNHN